MTRVRVSTTVDGDTLAACRRLLNVPDSRLLDQALRALIDQVEVRRELAAIEAAPYDQDPDLAWEVDMGPDLPYDGEVPAAVVRLAAGRRRRRQ